MNLLSQPDDQVVAAAEELVIAAEHGIVASASRQRVVPRALGSATEVTAPMPAVV